MEPTEGSTSPEPNPVVEAPAPVESGQPKPPSSAPTSGTKYVYNKTSQLWDVHRVDDAGTTTVAKGEDDLPEHLRAKSEPGTTDESGGLTLGDHLPAEIREAPGAETVLREASAALDYTHMEPQAKQRLVDLAADLHSADIEAGIPPLWNEEAIHGVLRQRWGAAYPERLARAQAAAKALGPAFLQWCGTDYRGNSPALLETLAIMADKEKLLGLSPADAAAKMKAWRSDPKHPLRNSLHPEHAVSLARARVLAILSEGKGRQGSVEEMVADRAAKAPAADSPEAKLDAEAAEIRRSPDYYTPGKNPALHKQLAARMAQVMRERWKD